jgi:hypothetical protein
MKSPTPPKPAFPDQLARLLADLAPGPRRVLLGGLIFFFIMAASTTLLLAYMVYQPQITAWLQRSTSGPRPASVSQLALPTPTITPTATATPQCVLPTLTLDETVYPLDALAITSPGVLPSPSGAAGTAWWVSDTFSPFVFLLKPGLDSPDLSNSLKPGDPMVVQWADCGREVFVLTNIQPGSPDAQVLLAQAGPGMAVIIQPDGTLPGYVINGQRPELINPPTPEPTAPNAIMVDITFEGTGLSDDQKTLQTSLTITNRDANPLIMASNDLSLTAEGQEPLSPLSVEPTLPQEIQPGGSLSLTITFPNPGGNTAVLKVLDTTVDLYY